MREGKPGETSSYRLCVPVVDKVQDQLNSNLPGKRYEKLTAPNGTTFNVSVWYSGTPEQFLNHVKQGLNAVRRG